MTLVKKDLSAEGLDPFVDILFVGMSQVSLMTDVEDLKQNVRARMSKHTYSVKELLCEPS